MIKRLICLLCVAVTAAACNRPRNIPDEKLIAITREIFLANAYRDSPKSGFSQADTVDFYTPIFEKYGYKPSDLSYTINNLSRRKSVRFTDILEEVARRLDREDSLMKARIATLDTVDSRTMNRYRRVVYSDSTRRLRRLSDPDKPDIVLPVRPGRYQVAFKYDLDTSSRNGNLRYTHYQFDTTDGTKGSFYYLGYIKGAQKQEIFSFDVTDPKTNEVRISLATSPSDKEKSIVSYHEIGHALVEQPRHAVEHAVNAVRAAHHTGLKHARKACVDDRRRAAALTDDCIISHVNLQNVNFQAITMFSIVQSHGAFKYFRSKFRIFSVRDCQVV